MLVKYYYNIDPLDPIAAIIYHLESRGLSAQDLQALLGDRQVVIDLFPHLKYNSNR